MNIKTNDPYIKARMEHDALWNDMNARLRNWQIMAYLLAGIALVAMLGWIIWSQKAKSVPYVIEVDKLGQAISVAPAQEYRLTDEKVIRAYLFQYIDKVRTVVPDPDALKTNLEQVYKMSTPSVRGNVLDKFYQGNDPFVYAQKSGTKHVEPLSFLRQGESSYIVEWREIERNYDNQVLGESRYKAYISIVQIEPTKEDSYRENPLNPFGIYVTAFSWSKMM